MRMLTMVNTTPATAGIAWGTEMEDIQPIYAVTLATLREHHACFNGYNKVVRMLQGKPFSQGDDERESYIKSSHDAPISLVTIANNNGIDDALWTLRCISNCNRDARLFAVWCARQVEHLMADPRSKDALNVAEHFANGRATAEEMRDAAVRAALAVRASARAAARATRVAAYAADAALAADAADAAEVAAVRAARAVRASARAAQLKMFIAMCESRAPWQVK